MLQAEEYLKEEKLKEVQNEADAVKSMLKRFKIIISWNP